MDQIKTGSFLKALRKEKNLTQERLAETLGVSNRTVSRWETGSNMPDLGMLVEIADFYDVSIPEIIDGERKSGNMNPEIKETAEKMAEYGRNEIKNRKRMVIGTMLSAFGLFIIVSALAIFPNESSWGSVYSVFGSIILVTGVSFIARTVFIRRGMRILCAAGCAVFLFAAFHIADYVAAAYFHQVPRFRYETFYSSENPDQLVYKTLFFTAVCKNPGTENERVEIVK